MIIATAANWIAKWLPGPKETPTPIKIAVGDSLKIGDQVVTAAAIPSGAHWFTPSVLIDATADVKGSMTVEHRA